MKTEADRQLADAIAEHGWYCISVRPRAGQEGPGFSYTIGLVASYGHPELMIFGLGTDKSYGILSDCGALIKAGTRFPIEERVPNILARGFDVMFRPVRKECFGEYLVAAVRYYGHKNFEAYVLLWPDRENQFSSSDPAAALT